MRDKDIFHNLLKKSLEGLGRTYPNPSVGAIIVCNGEVVAITRSEDFGGQHAESKAIDIAKKKMNKLNKCILYVSLEPCSHYGKNPPCVDKIISHKIPKVKLLCKDPNPLVAGKGINKLIENGIAVEQKPTLLKYAKEVMKGHFCFIEKKRAYISLKVATTLDGYISAIDGSSKWITNDNSRQFGRFIRGKTDIIITGINTILFDNPLLDARYETTIKPYSMWFEDEDRKLFYQDLIELKKDFFYHPSLCIIDNKKVLLKNYNKLNITKTLKYRTIFVAIPNKDKNYQKALEEKGFIPIVIKETKDKQHIDIKELVIKLTEMGYREILVESGKGILSAFFNIGLFDRIYWFFGAKILGDKGNSPFSYVANNIQNAINLKIIGNINFGDSFLIILENRGDK